MAPSSKKRGAPASAAKKLVRHNGEPIRAVKSIINKAKTAAALEAAKTITAKVIDTTKDMGLAFVQTRRIGRPPLKPRTPWTKKLGDELFALIATGFGMDEIATMDGMPTVYEMLLWCADTAHPFYSIRTRAKEMLGPLYEERAKAITENPNPTVIRVTRQVLDKDGDVQTLVEEREVDGVERAKLAFQGVQWTLSHLNPKKHGRNADGSTGAKNEQLEGLFAALKAGPVE